MSVDEHVRVKVLGAIRAGLPPTRGGDDCGCGDVAGQGLV